VSHTPTLQEVIGSAIETALEDVHTAIPAKVVRYDAAKQLVDVQPLVKLAHEDEEGNRVAASLPVVCNCPVAYPGGGGFTVTFPLNVGDLGMLVFTESSLDKWQERGDEVDPTFDHRFSLADGFFIPGVRPSSKPRQTNPGTAIIVGQDGGTFQGAALGATLQSFLNSLKSYLDGHTHTSGGSGSPTSPPVSPSPSAPDIESDTVKITP
jgi:hypothetical protein